MKETKKPLLSKRKHSEKEPNFDSLEEKKLFKQAKLGFENKNIAMFLYEEKLLFSWEERVKLLRVCCKIYDVKCDCLKEAYNLIGKKKCVEQQINEFIW